MSDDHRITALTTLKPGNIIEWTNWKHRHHSHRWRVLGVHLGAEGPNAHQESVVTLENVSHSPAWDEVDLMTMHVPECLIRQCRIVYSGTDAPQQDGEPEAER